MSLPAARLREMLEEKQQLRALLDDYLEEGLDYGEIPGTAMVRGAKKKKVLYKAGAEKVTQAYGCFPRYEIVEHEVDHAREIAWRKEYGRRGEEKQVESGISVGLYRYVVRCSLIHRASGVVVAEGLGACSTMEAKYVRAPREAENTVLKMAKKRAHVDATLTAFGLSERFTQDIEDTGTSGDGEDADAEAQREAVAEQKPTLAEALEHPFPWRNPEKYAGKPLRVLSDRMLTVVKEAVEKDIAEKGTTQARQRLLDCVTLVQQARRHPLEITRLRTRLDELLAHKLIRDKEETAATTRDVAAKAERGELTTWELEQAITGAEWAIDHEADAEEESPSVAALQAEADRAYQAELERAASEKAERAQLEAKYEELLNNPLVPRLVRKDGFTELQDGMSLEQLRNDIAELEATIARDQAEQQGELTPAKGEKRRRSPQEEGR